MNAFARFLLVALLPVFVGEYASGEVVALAGEAAEGDEGDAGAGGGGPRFAARQMTEVRALEGLSATLECRVLNLGDKAVLWVRSRDLQILSHGAAVFTADARVSVPPDGARRGSPVTPAAHALRIDRLRAADAGRYECQLNTDPKMSMFVHLAVLDEAEAATEPTTELVMDRAAMWGEADTSDSVRVWALARVVAGAAGGAAELGCAARLLRPPPAAAPPLDIRWLRGGRPLTIQGGGAVWRTGGAASAESRLRLEALRPGDAGEYSCAVGDTAATVLLTLHPHVDVGDMEAMQRDESAGGGAGAAHSARLALVAALLARLAVP